MSDISGYLNVAVTIVYAAFTFFICKYNKKSAEATAKAVEESKNQFEESKKQFEKSIMLQTQHNYDSVRPAVTVSFELSTHGDSLKGSMSIMNHGLGPAIIKELRFTKDDKDTKKHYGNITIEDFIYKRLTEEQIIYEPHNIFTQIYTKQFRNEPNDKDYLAVGEKHLLLGFETESVRQSEIVESIFRGAYMELVYTDIYETKEWIDIKNLSYFKR